MGLIRSIVTGAVALAVGIGTTLAVALLVLPGAGLPWAGAHDAAAGAGGRAAYDDTPGAARTPTEAATPDRTPAPPTEPEPEPAPAPPPALHAAGDAGDEVRDLQARLVQVDWLTTVTGTYDAATVTAVEGFQAKRGLPVTGEVDQATLDRLHGMTGPPTQDELHGIVAETGALDPRCREGRVLCIDKTTRSLRWVVDGTVERTLDVRFGSSSTPTREGTFTVERKSREHVSTLYGSSMPYAMFFSRGQAVHYSSDFAARGYSGASHGCVNVRDRESLAALYDDVRVGDTVVVYWS